jgi:hypothetical protein
MLIQLHLCRKNPSRESLRPSHQAVTLKTSAILSSRAAKNRVGHRTIKKLPSIRHTGRCKPVEQCFRANKTVRVGMPPARSYRSATQNLTYTVPSGMEILHILYTQVPTHNRNFDSITLPAITSIAHGTAMSTFSSALCTRRYADHKTNGRKPNTQLRPIEIFFVMGSWQ